MLNYNLLKEVQAGFNKKAYVDPSMMGGDPAAMGGDPAAMGGAPMDPAAAGMPMDPAMAGMDPAMMAGDPAAMVGDPAAAGMPPAPPPGLDPAMAGLVGGASPAPAPADPAAAGGATITCTLDDLAKFMQKVLAIKNSGGIEAPAPQQNNDMAEIRQALTQIATSLQGGSGIA